MDFIYIQTVISGTGGTPHPHRLPWTPKRHYFLLSTNIYFSEKGHRSIWCPINIIVLPCFPILPLLHFLSFFSHSCTPVYPPPIPARQRILETPISIKANLNEIINHYDIVMVNDCYGLKEMYRDTAIIDSYSIHGFVVLHNFLLSFRYCDLPHIFIVPKLLETCYTYINAWKA